MPLDMGGLVGLSWLLQPVGLADLCGLLLPPGSLCVPSFLASILDIPHAGSPYLHRVLVGKLGPPLAVAQLLEPQL